MHILFITKDKRYLDDPSEQRELLRMMSEVTESLHVVVLTKRGQGYKKQKVDDHTWLYPTNSLFEFMYYFDGLSTIRRQVIWQKELRADIVLSDDATIAGWLGQKIATQYNRVWMINLHDFYWDHKSSLFELLSRTMVIPLKDIFANAFRIIAFSERVAIYAQSAALTDEEKAKVVVFPEIFTAPQAGTVDLKVLHPEFNFIVLLYLPRHNDTFTLAVGAMAILRQSYQRAGLVVMTNQKPRSSIVSEVNRAHVSDWVRFEVVPPESLPFTNANVFLYLNGGEEEDTMLIRAAAAGSFPIVAADSVVSNKILESNVNGVIIPDPQAESVASGIRTLNETPGLRELFRVNAGLLLRQVVVPTRDEMVTKLRDYFTYEYVEMKETQLNPDEKYLFEQLTWGQSFLGRIKARLAKIKDHYTKL